MLRPMMAEEDINALLFTCGRRPLSAPPIRRLVLPIHMDRQGFMNATCKTTGIQIPGSNTDRQRTRQNWVIISVDNLAAFIAIPKALLN